MQSHWSESPYGAFVLMQEAKLLQQALSVSAANSVALICDDTVFPVMKGEPLGLNKPNLFNANFSEAHLCDSKNEKNIETGSIDWVILCHALEQQKDPRALLREVTRILSDGGRVSVYGFNPFRRWSRKLWFWKDKSQANIQSELTQFRLHDWLRLLNYEVSLINTLVSPNLSRLASHRRKCSELDMVNTFPFIGLVYHIEAIRRHYPMTPVRMTVGKENKRSLQLVNPTASGRTHNQVP